MSGLEWRPFAASDGPALHSIIGPLEVGRWLLPAGRTEPFTLEECEGAAARHAAHHAAHGFGLWLATLDGEPVARAGPGHTVVGGRAEVELAWAVARPYWGRGIAVDLARAALLVVRERGIDGVVAFTREDNRASRRVMEKLGLVRERALDHAGLPHVLYREPSASIRPISS